MSVEGCGLDFDETMCSSAADFSVERNWNGHTVVTRTGNVSHCIRGYQMDGWGGIKNQLLPMKGSAGGSIEAKTDSDGESSVTGEVHVTVKDDNGNKVSVTAEGSIKNDGDGNVKTDGGIKVSVEKDF